ncbi:MAG: hypothetical protein E6I62_09425 [Chloroflexi bacterium]|nr:MAG: hypothetical protein E6I62_09425 [Chloroflexota bacterium]
MAANGSVQAPHRILILGGGFAGVMTAQALERRLGSRRDVEIWLVSRDNFMLFTPLLPEVCSGVLEPRHVVTPLREMLRHQSTWCITAEVEAIDTQAHTVTVIGGDGDPHRLHYDTLVMALGGITHTFGIPGLEEHAVGMKTSARPAGGPHLRRGWGWALRRRDRRRAGGLRPPRAGALLPQDRRYGDPHVPG